MAENVVAIDGSNTSATVPVFIRVSGSSGTAAATVAPGAGSGGLLVFSGQTGALTTLSAIAGATATGTVFDCGMAMNNMTAVALAVTGTVTTGLLTLMGSVDNATYVPSGTTLTLDGMTGAVGKTVTAVDRPFRWWRGDFSGGTGTYTVTVKLMGA